MIGATSGQGADDRGGGGGALRGAGTLLTAGAVAASAAAVLCRLYWQTSVFDSLKRRRRCSTASGEIEVERKILVDATLRRRILQCGGRKTGELRMVDTYYDTKCRRLCLADAWLRRRSVGDEVRWELKVGPGLDCFKHTAASYVEYTGADVCKKLKGFLSLAQPFAAPADLVRSDALEVLVRIATTRESFELEGHAIDVDTTDEGHIVAEVELTVDSDGQVPAAIYSIDAVCASLGIPPTTPPAPGKMEAALRAQRSDVLALLQQRRKGRPL